MICNVSAESLFFLGSFCILVFQRKYFQENVLRINQCRRHRESVDFEKILQKVFFFRIIDWIVSYSIWSLMLNLSFKESIVEFNPNAEIIQSNYQNRQNTECVKDNPKNPLFKVLMKFRFDLVFIWR
jgi:hypothetical protein